MAFASILASLALVSGGRCTAAVRRTLAPAAALTLVAALAPPPPAAAWPLVALTEAGRLVRFASERPAETRTIDVTGVTGRVIGIDVRPADGGLYGLTAANEVCRIDPDGGSATLVANLPEPFDGGARAGVDFNPQTDRLKLVSAEGRNLRVHPTLGAVATDAPLAFARDDRASGRRPRITAAAYTQSVAGAATTRLVEIDPELDMLILQDPPNDGILRTIGPLGVDFGPLGGFDVVTRDGIDHAFAASGATLYAVDVATGTARALGTIGDGRVSVVGLAVLSPAAAR
jgi:hypothetical protein